MAEILPIRRKTLSNQSIIILTSFTSFVELISQKTLLLQIFLYISICVLYDRVQAGHCFHLFTSLQYEEMQQYLAPEILRTRLEELCLMIKVIISFPTL